MFHALLLEPLFLSSEKNRPRNHAKPYLYAKMGRGFRSTVTLSPHVLRRRTRVRHLFRDRFHQRFRYLRAQIDRL